MNLVLAGEGPTAGAHTTMTVYQMIVLWDAGTLIQDQTTLDTLNDTDWTPNYTLAHEIGHLFGLDERYVRSTGSTMAGWEGNIMANTQQDRYTRLDGWHTTDDVVPRAGVRSRPDYTVLRRPWVGGGQIIALVEHVLAVCRATNAYSPSARSPLIHAGQTHSSDHHVAAYRDARGR